MIRGGSYRGFLKKKNCAAKSDENNLFSKLIKNKKFVHKTGGKMGLYGKKNLLVPLAEKGKKVCFWLGAKKKKVCTATGKKNS